MFIDQGLDSGEMEGGPNAPAAENMMAVLDVVEWQLQMFRQVLVHKSTYSKFIWTSSSQ